VSRFLCVVTRVGCLALLPIAYAGPAQAWGPTTHRVVHMRAIAALPKELREFLRDHRREMPTLSEEALPTRDEGDERRFAADRFGPFPFPELPTSEEELLRQRGETARQAGRLPWLIQASYARLVERFRSGDKAEILAEADWLALYLTDLHNPLAVTEDFDGQRSGQSGLWGRVALRLTEALAGQLDLDADVAHLVERPREHIFAILRATYVWHDNILLEDDLAARGTGGYGELYYESLQERLKPLLRQRLSAASRNVASYWYSAWVAAGRPALADRR
jgi:hypothetical protein